MNAKKLWRVFHRKIIHHDRRSIKIFISLETRSRAPTPNAGDWVTPIGIQISRFASEAQLSLFADHCCRWKSFKFGIYGICPGGAVQQTPVNSIRSNDTSPGPTIRTQPHFLLRAYVRPCLPKTSLSLSPAVGTRLIEPLPLLQHFSLSFRRSPFKCLSSAIPSRKQRPRSY